MAEKCDTSVQTVIDIQYTDSPENPRILYVHPHSEQKDTHKHGNTANEFDRRNK